MESNSPAESGETQGKLEVLHGICESYAEVVVKSAHARLVGLEAFTAIYRMNTERDQSRTQFFKSVPYIADRLLRIRPKQWNLYGNFLQEMGLVYEFSAFDSFLTDILLFLSLSFPTSVGKDSTLPVSTLLNDKPKHEILSDFYFKRAKAESYKTVVDRILHIRNTYHLDFPFSAATKAALTKYSDLRNNIVHNRSSFAIRFNEKLEIELKPSAALRLEENDNADIAELFSNIAASTYAAICKKLLRVKPDPRIKSLLLISTRGKKLAAKSGGANTLTT